jgi:hypothetical protein
MAKWNPDKEIKIFERLQTDENNRSVNEHDIEHDIEDDGFITVYSSDPHYVRLPVRFKNSKIIKNSKEP